LRFEVLEGTSSIQALLRLPRRQGTAYDPYAPGAHRRRLVTGTDQPFRRGVPDLAFESRSRDPANPAPSVEAAWWWPTNVGY